MSEMKGEVHSAIVYLKHKQIEGPSLFYSVQVDNEDKMINFFWVDGMSIADYNYFGDVACFDSTYQTNMYNQSFGVNHHRQTVLSGADLLLNETTESFIWLFHTFLHAMSGQAPKTCCERAYNLKEIVIV